MEYINLFLIIVLIVINVVLLIKFSRLDNSNSNTINSDEFSRDIKEAIRDMESALSQIEIDQQTTSRVQAKELNDLLLRYLSESNRNTTDTITSNHNSMSQLTSNTLNTINNNLMSSFKSQQENINKQLVTLGQAIMTTLKTDHENTQSQYDTNAKNISTSISILNTATETKLDLLINTLNENFAKLREENNRQIENIRATVSEKLDKALNEQFEKSFKGVLSQMNDLQKTMGELRGISTQVGSLEKALNGVKTRGIMGEVQLKSIIADVLTPAQYDIEVSTKPGSKDHVEIAIKLPERNGDGFVYLPIDSKCHLDRYEELLDAYSSGDKALINNAKKSFASEIREDARDINEKYISVPDTTPYAVLFVPFEGMYSEIVNLNLLDELNQLHITIAGPYTLMAILSTVTNYFQSLAIEKKSHEIERTLGKVKFEFNKYNETLSLVRKNLVTATKNLDHLQLTRTNAMGRALQNVTTITENLISEQDDDPLLISTED